MNKYRIISSPKKYRFEERQNHFGRVIGLEISLNSEISLFPRSGTGQLG